MYMDWSPALFVSELKRKAKHAGIRLEKIKTRSFNTSQYDHVQDKCIKTTVNQRSKIIGGEKVQRDLYSAFLIQNVDATLENVDVDRCNQSYDSFLRLHNQEVQRLSSLITPSSIGIKHIA